MCILTEVFIQIKVHINTIGPDNNLSIQNIFEDLKQKYVCQRKTRSIHDNSLVVSVWRYSKEDFLKHCWQHHSSYDKSCMLETIKGVSTCKNGSSAWSYFAKLSKQFTKFTVSLYRLEINRSEKIQKTLIAEALVNWRTCLAFFLQFRLDVWKSKGFK